MPGPALVTVAWEARVLVDRCHWPALTSESSGRLALCGMAGGSRLSALQELSEVPEVNTLIHNTPLSRAKQQLHFTLFHCLSAQGMKANFQMD